MFIPALKSCDFSERMLTDEPFKLILTIKMVYGLVFSRIIGISKIWIIMPCFAYAQRSSRLAHVPSAHSLIRLLQQAVVLLCSVKITNRMVILTEQSFMIQSSLPQYITSIMLYRVVRLHINFICSVLYRKIVWCQSLDPVSQRYCLLKSTQHVLSRVRREEGRKSERQLLRRAAPLAPGCISACELSILFKYMKCQQFRNHQ